MSHFCKSTSIISVLSLSMVIGCGHASSNTKPVREAGGSSVTCEDAFFEFEDEEVLAERVSFRATAFDFPVLHSHGEFPQASRKMSAAKTIMVTL